MKELSEIVCNIPSTFDYHHITTNLQYAILSIKRSLIKRSAIKTKHNKAKHNKTKQNKMMYDCVKIEPLFILQNVLLCVQRLTFILYSCNVHE